MQLDATGLAILISSLGGLCIVIGGFVYQTMLAPMRERIAVLEAALEKSYKGEGECERKYAKLEAEYDLLKRDFDELRMEVDELRRANRTRNFNEEDRRP